MDIQIWYAVFSSVVGYVIGILEHVGEVRRGGGVPHSPVGRGVGVN